MNFFKYFVRKSTCVKKIEKLLKIVDILRFLRIIFFWPNSAILQVIPGKKIMNLKKNIFLKDFLTIIHDFLIVIQGLREVMVFYTNFFPQKN